MKMVKRNMLNNERQQLRNSSFFFEKKKKKLMKKRKKKNRMKKEKEIDSFTDMKATNGFIFTIKQRKENFAISQYFLYTSISG
jgi:hypothetical protein